MLLILSDNFIRYSLGGIVIDVFFVDLLYHFEEKRRQQVKTGCMGFFHFYSCLSTSPLKQLLQL